jgi:hypothetical protein
MLPPHNLVADVTKSKGARTCAVHLEPAERAGHDDDSVTFHLTTAVGGNNMVIRGRSHTTINANGDVTVSYDDLSFSCG